MKVALPCHAWLCVVLVLRGMAAAEPQRLCSDPPPIVSSWDDLLEGIKTREDWRARRQVLKQRYLELICDEQKPAKPPLGLQVHETVEVEGIYRRQLISYQVEQDERAHAYLGMPLKLEGKSPAIVAKESKYFFPSKSQT